jgi:hypothetical protein
VEDKVFAQFIEEDAQVNATRWVVDTGTVNHMTGAHDTFLELDMSVSGTIKFGDGSVVSIEMCETIVFQCKDGEH